MKILEVIIVEDVNELVKQELEDKIGPINKRRSGWENVNTSNFRQQQKVMLQQVDPYDNQRFGCGFVN